MDSTAKKILIVRFSSIGDVLLVSPLLRALSNQAPQLEIHFITKLSFKPLLEFNPHIKKLHCFSKDFDECLDELKAESFDHIIDLHNNLRSKRLSSALGCAVTRFDKLNLKKLAAVYFKKINWLPTIHIVERYFATLNQFGVSPDDKGLELFIPDKDQVSFEALFVQGTKAYVALVVGGSYATKQIPYEKLIEIVQTTKLPIVVMGGPEDQAIAKKLCKQFPQLFNAVGNLNLLQSASLISKAEWVITGDTGLMHMAAAFNRKIVSLWGNTIPEFGMSPYKPHPENKLLEVKALPCRPCSKLGYHSCPAGHFKCMQEIDLSVLQQLS